MTTKEKLAAIIRDLEAVLAEIPEPTEPEEIHTEGGS